MRPSAACVREFSGPGSSSHTAEVWPTMEPSAVSTALPELPGPNAPRIALEPTKNPEGVQVGSSASMSDSVKTWGCTPFSARGCERRNTRVPGATASGRVSTARKVRPAGRAESPEERGVADTRRREKPGTDGGRKLLPVGSRSVAGGRVSVENRLHRRRRFVIEDAVIRREEVRRTRSGTVGNEGSGAARDVAPMDDCQLRHGMAHALDCGEFVRANALGIDPWDRRGRPNSIADGGHFADPEAGRCRLDFDERDRPLNCWKPQIRGLGGDRDLAPAAVGRYDADEGTIARGHLFEVDA